MRISDWSSDVCSSDLLAVAGVLHQPPQVTVQVAPVVQAGQAVGQRQRQALLVVLAQPLLIPPPPDLGDRKSVVEGKSVSVRVDLGGRRIIKKKSVKEHVKLNVIVATIKTHTKT